MTQVEGTKRAAPAAPLEATYAILGPLDPARISALALAPYRLHPDGDVYRQEVLLDTTNETLTSRGQALRVRHEAGQVIATLNGLAHDISRSRAHAEGAAIEEKIEAPIEEPIAGADEGDERRWPAALSERLLPLVGEEPLVPLVTLHLRRHTWTVLRGEQPMGTLALEDGLLAAGERTERVHELAVTLAEAGTRRDLTALGRLLSARLPLRPEPRGMLQRGLALRHQHRRLDGHLPLASVGRHAVHRHLRTLRRNEPVARAGADAEGVHKMRTAARRLRTALRVLEASPDFDRKRLRALHRGLRRLARALGDVRDLDVFLARVAEYADAHPAEQAGLRVLREELAARRAKARARLLKALDATRTRRLLDELEAFALGRTALPQHTQHTRHPRRTQPQLVRHFAGSAIWARYEAVLSFETALADAPPETLHALRIACKRLRYTLELFETELGQGTRPLLKALVKGQNQLGDLQDAVVALALVNDLREHAREGPQHAALAAYARALEEQRDHARHAFAPLWAALRDPGFAHELAALIAGL